MLKWFKLSRRNREEVVWEGRIIGKGKPEYQINVIEIKKDFLPKPTLPRKLFKPREEL
jgi:hypothetical protein